ncbi:MAG TPA: carbohydrate-binding family 9-like protein [Capsulimonadaceae bacterium]|jgi:hypothetical protein
MTQHDQNPPPIYTCHRIYSAPILTGRGDDPLWSRAESVQLVDPTSGTPPSFATDVRLLYDALTLYISFRCEDSLVWSTMVNHDDPIYTEECVEVFLCPSKDQHHYYEINVSPLNTVFDSFIANPRTAIYLQNALTCKPEYHCGGLVTKVAIDGEPGKDGARGWSAEYAIPFASVLDEAEIAPGPGDEWLMNLCRIDQPRPGQLNLSSWSRLQRANFHTPWRFGTLAFG